MVKFFRSFKKCVRSDGGEKEYSKNVQKLTRAEGSSRSIREPIFFIEVFIFVFHYFNGKVKTLTP